MRRLCFAVLALTLLPVAAAQATTPQNKYATPTPVTTDSGAVSQPNLISVGASWVDFDKDEPRTQSADFRLEYRWGASLVSYHNNSWFDFGLHPLAGIEFSTRSQLYGFGGLAFDLLFWKHVVFTESETVGLFDSGDAKPLGSFIEFRSQAELGWRFDNDMRVTGQISHISNAGLTKHNPGEEMVGLYVHVPVGAVFR